VRTALPRRSPSADKRLGCERGVEAELAAFGEDPFQGLGVEALGLVDDEQMRPAL
jgi:uncharacterized membrane protein